MLTESRGLTSDLIRVLEDANVVFYFNHFTSRFTVQTSDYDVIIDFRDDSMSLMTLFKKLKRHDNLLEAHVMR